MPVAPTYPGVYIEEIPSGVHTVTGVSTSVTAFIGYTARGPVNEPVHIFSFADFERAFGGITADSMLSYSVKQFFQNGGNEAYVVRVAQGAVVAQTTMRYATTGVGQAALDISAVSAGTWGNNLQVDVDYNTLNPASLFNMTVTEFVDRNGKLVPGRVEVFRNLSMNSKDPNFVIDTVNAGSQLVNVALSAGLNIAGTGTSTSGPLTDPDAAKVDATHNRLGVILDGRGPFEITLDVPPSAVTLDAVATDIRDKINLASGGKPVTFTSSTVSIVINSGDTTEVSTVHFIDGSSNSAAGVLKLGIANGGTEVEAQAGFRPVQTGTTGTAPSFAAMPATGTVTVNVRRGTGAAIIANPALPLWNPPAGVNPPAKADDLVQQFVAALNAATEPLLAGTTFTMVGGVPRLLSGTGDPNISLEFAATALTAKLGLTGAGVVRNIARYALGAGMTALGQVMGGAPGNNGTMPTSTQLAGNPLAKTGIYALEKVDLFNLLVMPDSVADVPVLTEAIAYCERRRAFIIIDGPEALTTFAQAQAWIGSAASPLRSRNAALYFPRLREPDPMMNNTIRGFPAAGAIAGLYARTDADRGVWKAPAGTSANVIGATGLAVNLTNSENGTLNPLALNCIRTFPVYGTVSWGARTARGADALADEYKYVPVRRLALFLEESLYRGTQWAVFEPNDEPLWAQIRLNLGAFMHTLFAQGAFQGRTPRDAYFVKCDKETTTQNDIDLGRVNIVVGFAPLKPAEFVIIQIQQIAGALQT